MNYEEFKEKCRFHVVEDEIRYYYSRYDEPIRVGSLQFNAFYFAFYKNKSAFSIYIEDGIEKFSYLEFTGKPRTYKSKTFEDFDSLMFYMRIIS